MKINKYLLYLTSEAKVRRFQFNPNDQGMLGFGKILSSIPTLDGCKKGVLKLHGFVAFANEMNLDFKSINEKADECLKYENGESELSKNKEFAYKFDSFLHIVDLMEFSNFGFFMAGSGAWLSLLSLGLIYFSWWFLIAPLVIWVIATAFSRAYHLNWSACYAILARQDETFMEYCKQIGLIQDMPEDFSKFSVISDSFGTGNMKVSLDGKWDENYLRQVKSDLDKQESVMQKIYSDLLMKKVTIKLGRES
jgi:hypothetical protein